MSANHSKVERTRTQVRVGVQQPATMATQFAADRHAIAALFRGIDHMIDQSCQFYPLLRRQLFRFARGCKLSGTRRAGFHVSAGYNYRWGGRQDQAAKIGQENRSQVDPAQIINGNCGDPLGAGAGWVCNVVDADIAGIAIKASGVAGVQCLILGVDLGSLDPCAFQILEDEVRIEVAVIGPKKFSQPSAKLEHVLRLRTEMIFS